MQENPLDPLEQAKKKAGSLKELAVLFGVTTQAISQWRVDKLPAKRVAQIARLIDVDPHELRPDVFPAPERVG